MFGKDYGLDNSFADVEDGVIIATDSGEWGAKVVWRLKNSQPLLQQIYFFITRKENPIKNEQIISHDHIKGLKNTNYGLLGYGGFSHLFTNDGGYVVKFYKVNDSWKSKRIISTKESIADLKECSDGLRLLLDRSTEWIHYSFIDKKFKIDDPISLHEKKDTQKVVIGQSTCSSCNQKFPMNELVQCGPCFEQDKRKKMFCRECWTDHQWTHGKAPAVGIEFHQDGSISGYDGSESLKSERKGR